MQYQYQSFVDSKNICENNGGTTTYRYELIIPFLNGNNINNILCVILKNPSIATSTISDQTIYNVCNFAHQNGYSCVKIYNLFPFRATNPSGLVSFYNSPSFKHEMNRNLNILINGCCNNDTIFAWGTNTVGSHNPIYTAAISSVVNGITSPAFYVGKCSCANCKQQGLCTLKNHQVHRYPLHGQMWNKISNPQLIRY